MLTADRAVIAADQAQLRVAKQQRSRPAIATALAQLAKDKAQAAVDRAEAASARIFAPSAGTVVAVNGLPGETADAEGIRELFVPATGTADHAAAALLLFPEGPQPSTESGGSAAASLPAIALRTSNTWQVVVLVPENQVPRTSSRVR